MRVRTQHSDEFGLYFVTFTCYKWLPLFHVTHSYDLVYKWFGYLKDEKIATVTAFVIMPNHLHCILFFPAKGFSLNTIIGNAKRFMAYEILKRLEFAQRNDILQLLRNGISATEA